METYFIYLFAVFVIAVTPGTSMVFVSAQGMRYGLKTSFAVTLGDIFASMIQMSVAFMGLTVLMNFLGEMFVYIKWCGVIYLFYLGIRFLMSDPVKVNVENAVFYNRPSFQKSFLQGFLVCMANPKAILFFAGFFPAFIDPNLPFLFQFLALGATFALLDGLGLMGYASLFVKVKTYFNSYRVWQNRIAGFMLFAAGFLLAKIEK